MSDTTPRGKRALITGVNGFVGGHLAEYLLASGWDVWGVGRQAQLTLPELRGKVHYHTADLTRRDEVRAALNQINPDVVFHLAAQSSAHRSFAAPEETLLTNTLPQINLFQSALDSGRQPLFVIASSSEVYGAVRPDELPLNEDTPLRPVNPYAVSKVAQDLLAYQYFMSHHVRTVRLRVFSQLGPRQTEQFVASAFAAQVARIERGKQEPVLRVGNLDAERDFTDIRDMVRAYVEIALHAIDGAVYNVGSGQSIRIRTLLDMLLEMSTRAIAVESDPERMRPSDTPRMVCDYRRIHAATGWEPRIPLRQTLADLLDDWRAKVRHE